MKKIIVSISLLLAMLAASIMQSCTESTSEEMTGFEENLVIFEDLNLKSRVSKDPLENHIFRKELLGNNEEMERIVGEIENRNMDLEGLDIYGIQKCYLNNSEIIMYSVPFISSENVVIIYAFEDVYQVMVAVFEKSSAEQTEFRLSTLDGELYYGMSIKSENRIGNFKTSQNSEIDAFSNEVIALEINQRSKTERMTKSVGAACCRQMNSWAECINCTVDAFSGKWFSNIAFAIVGKEYLAAIGVSCIGARPKAIC